MTTEDRAIEPGSETDLALERALQAANLRPGDSTTTAVVVEDWTPSAAEVGDAGADGD
jgi:hypothetical protein